MAISPEMLNEEFMREVEFYEKTLDSRLASKKLAPNGYLTLEIPSGMSSSHFEILRRRYLDVGWTEVGWQSDQREGDWLVFKA